MGYGIKNVLFDLFVDYGVSGERREAAKRQFILQLWLGAVAISAGLAMAVFVALFPTLASWAIVFYGFVLIAELAVLLYALRKRETGMQLWHRERQSIQKNREENLQEVQRFMAEMSQKGKDNGIR